MRHLLLFVTVAVLVGLVVYLMATALFAACPGGIDLDPNSLVNICPSSSGLNGLI